MNVGRGLLVALLVVCLVVPAAALSVPPGDVGVASSVTQDARDSDERSVAAAAGATARNASGRAAPGQRVSAVISVASSDVQSAADDAAFEASVDAANDSARAEALADRAETLRESATDIREGYEEATRSYEEGDLTASQYANRLAVLNARAEAVLAGYERYRTRAATVSEATLLAAGVDRTALRTAIQRLDVVTGAGPTALRQLYVGDREGEFELETADGLTIEVESEDGEFSRAVRRPRDDSDALTTSQAAALETARASLTDRGGRWVVERASVHAADGSYRFEFRLVGPGVEGEAEVRVDGSSGEAYRIEEEVEPAEDGEDGEDDGEEELVVLLVGGEPAPNATVTLQVRDGGEPVPGATVSLNDRVVGTTDAGGEIRVTLPADRARIEASTDDGDAELRFEFADGSAAVLDSLDFDASLDGERVTLTVRDEDEPLSDATVLVDGDPVGTTDGDGTVEFATGGRDDFDVVVRKGQLAVELAYEVRDGSLVLVEGPELVDASAVPALSLAEARSIARDALSTPGDGTWVLEEERLNGDRFEFEFRLDSETHTGDARVVVDASTGAVLDHDQDVDERN